MPHKKQINPKFRKLALIGFCVAAFTLIVFVGKLLASIVYWNDQTHHNQVLEPWMSIGYIARSYNIERSALIEALPYNLDQSRRKSLKDIAAANDVSIDRLTAELDAILADLGTKND